MKKSETLDDIIGVRDDADAVAPALARTPKQLIELWYDQYRDAIYRYLVCVYGEPAAPHAKDAVNEAFLRLYRALLHGESIDNPKAWALTVARRLFLNEIKRAGSEETKHRAFARLRLDAVQTPHHVLCEQRRQTALQRAWLTLSELERNCLALKARGLKLVDVGRILNLDYRRVGEIIDRAVRKLSEKVSE